MTRMIYGSIATAILAGFLVFADIAEAQRVRSPVERRLRPGQGFWHNGSSQTRSYSGYSNGYSAPRYYAPQTQPQYSAPRYVMPHRQYVPQQHYVMPQRQYVQPRTYVVQPPASKPTENVSTTPKKTESPAEAETGE